MKRRQGRPQTSRDPCGQKLLIRILPCSFPLRSRARRLLRDVTANSSALHERLFEGMKKLETQTAEDFEAARRQPNRNACPV
jgi:hypothetical protein